MLNAAVAGLGWWGATLVDAVKDSDLIRITAALTRSRSAKDQATAAQHGLTLTSDFQTLLDDPKIEAIILATPPSGHRDQIVAAAKAGKHVFCEKPLVMTQAEAREAVNAVQGAGVTLGLGFNRRFHPSWQDLKARVQSGDLGVIEHIECTMSGPNGLAMPAGAWRASAQEAPLGGLFPMGVHAIDGFIDLVGEIDQVFCQSTRRAAPGDNDDTTSILFRASGGMTAYLGTLMASAGVFRFQVYGSKGMALLGGMVHVAGHSSHQRRSGLFGSYMIQRINGETESLAVPEVDVNRAELEAFAQAVAGGPDYPIPIAQMIHGVAVTDAVLASARTGQPQLVQ